jgi:hypothetical protein
VAGPVVTVVGAPRSISDVADEEFAGFGEVERPSGRSNSLSSRASIASTSRPNSQVWEEFASFSFSRRGSRGSRHSQRRAACDPDELSSAAQRIASSRSASQSSMSHGDHSSSSSSRRGDCGNHDEDSDESLDLWR